MMSRKLVTAATDWRYKIIELKARLNVLRPRLINAEAELADQLARLNAFEFRLRSLTNPLIKHLERLDEEIGRMRQRLRDLDNGLTFTDQDYDEELVGQFDDFGVRSGEEAGSQEAFRYRENVAPQQKRAQLSQNEEISLKRLYRQLARRFHPDLGKSPEERAQRTQLMMRINAAYHAADIEALRKLSQMPDPESHFSTDDEQLEAEKLGREIERCQARMAEIRGQMERLRSHKSANLLKRYERAQESGRDLLAEIVIDMRNELGRRTAERDHLQDQLENFGKGGFSEGSERVADAILQMGLELGLDDDDTSPDAGWHSLDDESD